jgi:hypothetical protein
LNDAGQGCRRTGLDDREEMMVGQQRSGIPERVDMEVHFRDIEDDAVKDCLWGVSLTGFERKTYR